jgi:hypothetical protein
MPSGPSFAKALIKVIRGDDFRNWEEHVRKFEKKQKEPLKKEDRLELGRAVYDAVLHDAVANLQLEEDEKAALIAVQAHFGLSEEDTVAIKKKYAPKALRMLADWFLTDGIVTRSERAQLLEFGKQMCVDEEEVIALLKGVVPKGEL